ncbi:MAG: cobyric acid synthase [Opitutales bacterium]|nr:cobyric acid synthase [Opitutales bacterium]
MKAISILGTSSNAGKSWINTAFCALLARNGYKVAPFKAQNMSNNSFVTLEGGEIGRAQAAQAEACGLRPIAQMNPVLLKPTGESISQVVWLGIPGKHIKAGDYYLETKVLWEQVCEVMDWWKSRCDVLVLEGAGSPVELNLMQRDIVNLKPIEYLQGRWILACDIERGGVFAQAIGTVNLMPQAVRDLGMGLIVNKFRGDPGLFKGADTYFAEHIATPYMGVLPLQDHLQPENEDGFSLKRSNKGSGAKMVWIDLPRVSNTQDCEPWNLDEGIRIEWANKPKDLEGAKIIVIPGSKNTIHDLLWLQESGLAEAIREKAATGIPVVGICGGFQMLGESIDDPEGIAGSAGSLAGLNLLPVKTHFESEKTVRQVTAMYGDDAWSAYEIHMGRTLPTRPCHALLKLAQDSEKTIEGYCCENVWGTYLHGLFESAAMRRRLVEAAGIKEARIAPKSWHAHKQEIYSQMADLLESCLNLDAFWRYVEQ